MILAASVSILMSALLIGALGWKDPKRLRNVRAGVRAQPFSHATRRVLGWLIPLPGLVLMLMGAWWALLAWLGASCTLGWAVATWLSPTHAAVHGAE